MTTMLADSGSSVADFAAIAISIVSFLWTIVWTICSAASQKDFETSILSHLEKAGLLSKEANVISRETLDHRVKSATPDIRVNRVWFERELKATQSDLCISLNVELSNTSADEVINKVILTATESTSAGTPMGTQKGPRTLSKGRSEVFSTGLVDSRDRDFDPIRSCSRIDIYAGGVTDIPRIRVELGKTIASFCSENLAGGTQREEIKQFPLESYKVVVPAKTEA